MIRLNQLLSSIPSGLRQPLIEEYNNIVRHYLERLWSPAELSGGKFCEIVYTILDGYASGAYATSPSKPSNFVDACRKLESNSAVPRSFQILIPRMLPALYEIRNNRNVGHVGGDVDPNHMDATTVLSMSSWIIAELIRVFHNVKTEEAQELVDSLIDYKIPLVWQSGDTKRVLNPKIPLREQILILLLASSESVTLENLLAWTEAVSKANFNAVVKKLHKDRYIELNNQNRSIQILPPGTVYIRQKLPKINSSQTNLHA